MLSGRLDLQSLLEGIRANMRLDQFEEYEISAAIKMISSFKDEGVRTKVIVLCHSLSRSSSTLIPRTLKHIRTASESLPPEDLVRWLDRSSEILDSAGIREFVSFTLKTGADDVTEFQSPEFLTLRQASGVLEIYLRAISGRALSVSPDAESYTDTEAVYLPPGLSRYRDHELNFILYEFMAAHKWAEINMGTLIPRIGPRNEGPGDIDGLESIIVTFLDRDLAIDLYTILEAFMLDPLLSRELPGLMLKADKLKSAEYGGRPALVELTEKTAFVEAIYQYYLKGLVKGKMPSALKDLLPDIDSLAGSEDPARLIVHLAKFYDAAEALPGEYAPKRPFFFFGTIRPDRIAERQALNREEKRKKVRETIRKLLRHSGNKDLKKRAPSARSIRPDQDYFLSSGLAIEADEDVREAVRQTMPAGSLVKGKNIRDDRVAITIDEVPVDSEEIERGDGGLKYDEWDYLRGDYRKKWCTLFEVDMIGNDDLFIEKTLAKFGGAVKKLREQFELLRPYPALTRRNKEGDLIDLEAAVEAYSDLRAGFSPDENLYFRLERRIRDIAVLFLIDMSDSTQGWVNTAEKESLVLMCEALEKLGDTYAISGFSGNTRFECLYFRIKKFSEQYSAVVKKRISGISPRDYTRMGPPIRHSVRILSNLDSKKKLLVVITDGKPQDIGQYSGDYAIEDTRMALLEAKGKGISPICITLDREAKSYIPHMYRGANYFVIDNPSKLPRKLTEVYRKLTT